MAAFTYTAPVVGGSENTWGTTLNQNWADLSTFLGSLDSSELATLVGVTATTAELNTTDGIDTAGTGFGYVPQGGIIMWSGSVASIPSGWHLCNGSNSTPDLRDRFVVGAGANYAVNATGGEGYVTLVTGHIPAHTHSDGTLAAASAGGHDHAPSGGHSFLKNTLAGAEGSFNYGSGSSVLTGTVSRTSTEGVHTHDITGSTGSAGGGAAHENRPPYFALAYIMKA